MTKVILNVVAGSQRRAPLIVLLYVVAILLSLIVSVRYLGLDTNTSNLFAASLPWRQQQIRFERTFPQFNNLIVAVVRARTPEQSDETAKGLAGAIAKDPRHFIDVSRPGSGPFYRQQGLLLLPEAKLVTLLNNIIEAQPFLGQLAADPSAAGLFNSLGLIAQGVKEGQADLKPYDTELRAFEAALQQSLAGNPQPLSWQNLVTPSLNAEQNGLRFVLIHPVLNHNSLEPGGAATRALRHIIATLPEVQSGAATVNYTGQIPLSDEQFASLTDGMFFGLVVSVALISLWLTLAVRSWRMIFPILGTLIAGLILTVGFAALAIGRLNLISVAFAILFVGLAVDFAIQFCVRLRDARFRIHKPALAILAAAREAGVQIALAAVATATGFLAFVPTNFIGVAELGLIAGVGMFVALFCTITLLPALLTITKPTGEAQRIGFPLGDWVDYQITKHHRPILISFAGLAMFGTVAATTLQFDANPLDTQNQNTEAMRTLHRLTENSITNPFYITALTPSLSAARILTTRLAKLPDVDRVISGATFVPENQSIKLDMIRQAKQILAPSLLSAGAPTVPTAATIRAAALDAGKKIEAISGIIPKQSPLGGIGRLLIQVSRAPDGTIMAMNAALTKYLPGELQRLSDALSAKLITEKSLPNSILRDWFLPNGSVRIQVIPTSSAENSQDLARFVHAVQKVTPDIAGPAVTAIATSRTIISAFREAAVLAAIAICLILLVFLRSARDAGVVIVTLALSALLTALFARLAGLSLNYANIIALPLLLGVGVSFNIYFVMNWRTGMRRLLGSATARAVLFSALTTGTAFGSLAVSRNAGTASMGAVLLLSLFATLISTFLFLPALLHALPRRK